jgi:phosphatidate phosphatase APP1
MSSLSTFLIRAGKRLDTTADELRLRLRHRFRIGYGTIHILPYRSYGVADQLTLMGRVIERTSDILPDDDDNWWDNLVNMYRHFASREIAGAELRISYGDAHIDTVTDAEGYFRAELPLNPALLFPGWIKVNGGC